MSADDLPPPAEVPPNARKNLDLLQRFQDAAEREASPVQLAIERTTRFFGSPAYLVFVVLFAAGWIGIDSWGRAHGWAHMEPPPFFWLQGLVSFNALLLTIAVLIRQRRMSELDERRAHLDLQVNLLTEQKVTKILQLLHAGKDTDEAALDADGDGVLSTEELSRPVDPRALMKEIKRTTGDH